MAYPDAKINVGADGPKAWLQAGLKYGWNDSGPFQSYSKEGTQTEIEDLVQGFINAGWNYTVTRMKGGICRIEGNTKSPLGGNPATEELENVWELEGNEVSKDVLEADFPFSGTNSAGYDIATPISSNDRQLIRSALDRSDLTSDLKIGTAFATADYAAGAIAMYKLMKSGVTNFPVTASVIRHTKVVSNQYQVQCSFNNVGRLITQSNMYSVEGVPGTLLFAVPTFPTVTQYIEDSGDLVYAWRKPMPSVTRQSSVKWRVSQLWQYGLWATKLYGAAI